MIQDGFGDEMSEAPSYEDIKDLSFEEALEELESIVRSLEEGQGALDASIQAYERGARLKSHLEAKLKEAEARVDKIVLNGDGRASSLTDADLD